MNWSSVASNQTVSYDSMQSAVDNGIFLALGIFPPSGVSSSRCVTKALALSYLDIKTEPLDGVANNELVIKSQLEGKVYTFYELAGCGSVPTAWTRVEPTAGTGQRYVLYGSEDTFYTYTGTSQGPQSNYPSGFNGSIQRVDGQTGCPS